MTPYELSIVCQQYTASLVGFATFVGIIVGVVLASLAWSLALLWRGRNKGV